MSDVVVCGVTGDIVLEDIAFSVPKGHAVTVPEHLAAQSKDLYRALSTGAIFQLNVNSLLAPRPQGQVVIPLSLEVQQRNVELEMEITRLRAEAQRLQGETTRLQGESGRYQAENAKLRAENLKLLDTNKKLDGILDLLKERPMTVVQQVVGQNGGAPKTVEEGAAPTYIPSQIRPENVTSSRITVEEGSSGSGGISKASDALRKLKKQSDSGDQ